MKQMRTQVLATLILAGIALLLSVQSADAHPMGNFSINHYAVLSVGPGTVRILYVIDEAEIPTFQQLSALGANSPAEIPASDRATYRDRLSRNLQRGISLRFNGSPVRLTLKASDLIFPPGAGGLATERIYLVLDGVLPHHPGSLAYYDGNFAGRAGWKEIVVRGESGTAISRASTGSSSRSRALTVYPSGVTTSPPQQLSASIEVPTGTWTHHRAAATALLDIKRAEAPLYSFGGHWSDLARSLTRVQTSTTRKDHASSFSANRNDPLSALMTGKQLSFSLLLLSMIVAFWFGAGHALSPGHGKTVVAAYLVGSRGTIAHAALLGLTVTVTHTAGVFALGGVTLYLSNYIVPDRLYPILGLTSGLLVALMGLTMFAARLRAHTASRSTARREHAEVGKRVSQPLGNVHDGHGGLNGSLVLASVKTSVRSGGVRLPMSQMRSGPYGSRQHFRSISEQSSTLASVHDAGTTHQHGIFGRPHTHGPLPGQNGEKVSVKSLLALGVSGGLLPCPSALVVLLSAIAFHRVAFGMLLIVMFSLGLASVLTGIGILVVYSGKLLSHLNPLGRGGSTLLPVLRGAVGVLPILSALIVMGLGSAIAVGAISPDLLPPFLPKL